LIVSETTFMLICMYVLFSGKDTLFQQL